MKRRAAALCLSIAITLGLTGAVLAAGVHATGFGTTTVGPKTGQSVLLPDNQWLNPEGTRALRDNDGRIVSSTVSPDGKYMAALTWQEFTGFLTIIDLSTNKIVQEVGAYPGPYLGDENVAADGPFYSPDGTSLWVPQVYDIIRFTVDPTTGQVSNPVTINLPTTGPGGAALPSGMALSADGSTLYVALNGYNTLGVIDNATNQLINQIQVGIAPCQVVLVGGTAYVSNEGGYPTGAPSYNYTTTNYTDDSPVMSDPVTGMAVTGTVSAVDLGSGKETEEIGVGLQPTAEYLAPDGTTLLVANSNSDNVSVINTSTNKVVKVISTNPIKGTKVGSNPNALFMPDASHLLVSIGRDNALAVYSYSSPTSIKPLGMIPTDWYPVAVSSDATTGQLVVTNDKGIGSFGFQTTISKGTGTNPAKGWNTYSDTSTLTEFNWSTALAHLSSETSKVFSNNGWNGLGAVTPVSHSKAKPVPLPATLGDPSTIKHVFLIVRENRTYDQLLGDMKTGNGDKADAQFGVKVTPNAHALASRFGLFDNFYDPATLSADGHNWIMQANSNDYIEKEFGAFYRSYPSVGADALAYQPSGFLWTDAENVHKTVADFGEYEGYQSLPYSGAPSWTEWYKDSRILEGKAKGPLPIPVTKYLSSGDVPSINQIEDPLFPVFNLNIPDQYRADIWLQVFNKELKRGTVPNLTLMTLPDDHTGGAGNPIPIAQVADNDLATARVVQAISHSKVWKSSLIIVEEDDSQNGVDHVDGHRAPLWMISPWVKQSGVVNNTYYTQLNVDKTLEMILGMPPLNQMDRAAAPMTNVFTAKPDMKPFNALPEKISLTDGVTNASRRASAPAKERKIAKLWLAWEKSQPFNGFHAAPDMSNPALLNRLDWYSAHNWTTPYPGDKKVLSPDQVPGGVYSLLNGNVWYNAKPVNPGLAGVSSGK